MMQDETEFAWLVSRLKHITSLLEIGSCEGGSLRGFVEHCPKLAKVRSIDIAPRGALKEYIEELNRHGFDANLFGGSSGSPEAIQWAKDSGPYDFIFIDGDHDAGVFVDWDNYRGMAPLVGFHDIAHTGHQVHVLWQKITEEGLQVEQHVTSYMGVGLVRMPKFKVLKDGHRLRLCDMPGCDNGATWNAGNDRGFCNHHGPSDLK